MLGSITRVSFLACLEQRLVPMPNRGDIVVFHYQLMYKLVALLKADRFTALPFEGKSPFSRGFVAN